MNHDRGHDCATGCMANELVAAMFGFVSQQQYPVAMEPVVSVTRCTGVLSVQRGLMTAPTEMYSWVSFALY